MDENTPVLRVPKLVPKLKTRIRFERETNDPALAPKSGNG